MLMRVWGIALLLGGVDLAYITSQYSGSGSFEKNGKP